MLLALYAFCGLRLMRGADCVLVGGGAALELPEDPTGYFERSTMMLLEDVGNPPVLDVSVSGLLLDDVVIDSPPAVAAESETRAEVAVERALNAALVARGYSLRGVASAGRAWIVERGASSRFCRGREVGHRLVLRPVHHPCARSARKRSCHDGVRRSAATPPRQVEPPRVAAAAIAEIIRAEPFDQPGFSYRAHPAY